MRPYLDHGGVLVNHFFPSAVPPRRAGSVAATRALRPGLSLHLTPTLSPPGIEQRMSIDARLHAIK